MDIENGKVLIYHLVFFPRKAIEYLVESKEDKHMGIALLVMVCGVIFNILSKAIVSLNRTSISTYIGIGGFLIILNFVGNLVLFTAIIFFIRNFALSRKEQSLYEDKNCAVIFFKLVCFSFVPFLFTPVISLFGLSLSLHNAVALYYILKMTIYFWIVFLQILIIRKLFNLRILTSIALYILPIIGLFAFMFIKLLNVALSFISIVL